MKQTHYNIISIYYHSFSFAVCSTHTQWVSWMLWISPILGRSAAFTVKPNMAAGFTFCIFFFFFLLDLELPPPPAAAAALPLPPAPPPTPTDNELWSAESDLPVPEEFCSLLELRVLSLVRDFLDCLYICFVCVWVGGGKCVKLS